MAPYTDPAALRGEGSSGAAQETRDSVGTERAAPGSTRPVKAAGLREICTLVRASISSAGATAIDGIAYQVLLVALGGAYGTAAFAGALLGAVTNFTINRRWAFRSTRKRIGTQATEYALASLVTYAALQTCLFVLVEFVHVDGHIAWVPAKIVAWLCVSYPVQRFLVFADRREAVFAIEPDAAGDDAFFSEAMDEPEVQRAP